MGAFPGSILILLQKILSLIKLLYKIEDSSDFLTIA